ncbi:unnamed protein product [Heligmosomoides polygyrus]|uniref:GST N-terminal domain-containing protein n=1 Tax=Heligmosomoides polygyrus TaxID=6339 RepID=A0A183GCB3_HELPZ|nr:unnamed protein product [Heligmosomoides polygyrus]
MVHYKLTYFNGRGLAEIIRQVNGFSLFVVAKQDYEDVRLSFEEWPKHKDEMPFGQMPVLEVDGKKLCQSHAIGRYLARKFGYAGKSEFEQAAVDSIMDESKDFLLEVRPYFRTLLGFEKGDLETLVKEAVLPARDKFFPLFTKFLKNNKSGEGVLRHIRVQVVRSAHTQIHSHHTETTERSHVT